MFSKMPGSDFNEKPRFRPVLAQSSKRVDREIVVVLQLKNQDARPKLATARIDSWTCARSCTRIPGTRLKSKALLVACPSAVGCAAIAAHSIRTMYIISRRNFILRSDIG